MKNDELIAHIRARVLQMRRIAALAHDPKMIEMLNRLAEEGEADIARLEADGEGCGEAAPEIKVEPSVE